MTLWYLARAAGVVAMVMFTVSASLGILTSGSSKPERRFWLQYVHRSAAATGLILLVTHVVAVISDSYVAISPTVLVWPFGSGYRPFAMVVGTLALYGLVLAALVGAARGRLAQSEAFTKHWRTIHIAASAGWLLSIGHALLAGTDRSTPWMLAIAIGCLIAVATAGAYRVRSRAARASTPLNLARAGRTPMTTMQATRTTLRVIGEPRLLAGLDHGRADRQRHLSTHGAQPELTRADYTKLAEAVGLLGRGGAAFPIALKLADLPAKGVEAVVVNGSESEPVSRKDRLLLTLAPHLVLDGATGLARALGAPQVLIAVHDAEAAMSIREALMERDDGVAIEVSDTPGRFVAGEARAVLSVLEGGPAVPPGRRVLPTRKGYHRRPTFLSNVETFAQLAVLARLGAKGFSGTGLISEPGTQLLTVGGAVQQPGVIETPTGVPLEAVLRFAGAEPGPVLLGGYHGRWLPHGGGVVLKRPDVSAGIILALGTDTCLLGEVQRVSQWLANQSAGQCGPCVFGLAALVDDFDRLVKGDPSDFHDAQRHLGLVPGRGACAHPDGSARFLASALEVFGEDVRLHLAGSGCGRQVKGILPVPGGAW